MFWEERGIRNHIRRVKWVSFWELIGWFGFIVKVMANVAPSRDNVRAVVFIRGGRGGGDSGRIKIQFIILPPEMAAATRSRRGVADFILSSLSEFSG